MSSKKIAQAIVFSNQYPLFQEPPLQNSTTRWNHWTSQEKDATLALHYQPLPEPKSIPAAGNAGEDHNTATVDINSFFLSYSGIGWNRSSKKQHVRTE